MKGLQSYLEVALIDYLLVISTVLYSCDMLLGGMLFDRDIVVLMLQYQYCIWLLLVFSIIVLKDSFELSGWSYCFLSCVDRNSCKLNLTICHIESVWKFSNYFKHYWSKFDVTKPQTISCKDSSIAV